MMKRILLFILFAVSAKNTFASTGGYIEYICPLCNTKFESWTQFSYTTFGQNLDLRPYGAAVIPNPIPKCSNCKFVFTDKYFSEEEILILKTKLKDDNIFDKEPNMPNYYYLAKEAEMVNGNLEKLRKNIFIHDTAILELFGGFFGFFFYSIFRKAV